MNSTNTKSTQRQLLKLFVMIPFLGIVFLFQSISVQAQVAIVAEPPEIEKVNPEQQTQDQIFTVVEDQPEFPGGTDSLMTYLMQNLRYPKEARDARIQGTVFVTFVVEKDGSVSDVRTLRGVAPSLDEEAIRVVRAMPAWKPGYQRGQTVRVQYNLPIRFIMDPLPPKDAVNERE
ncbi:MAG: energy transducer TonB [Bacteroidales bacterium]|nr:energy transducer TonB [Bacteroidales bacterium]